MNIFELPVHPHAAIYPMLPDDEMQELAESIAAHGQMQPIIIGNYKDEIHIIDGRNRLEACRIAEVEPIHEMINGIDPVALIASSNLSRRHMTKGQRAMAMAMHYPKPTRGQRNDLSLNNDKLTASDKNYLSRARKIREADKQLADEVLAGTEPLSRAYDEIKEREKVDDPKERMLALQNSDSDLAEQVAEGTLTMEGAEAEAKQRRTNEKMNRDAKYKHMYQLYNVAGVIRNESHIEAMKDLMDEFSDDFIDFSKRTLTDYLETIEVVEKNIGFLKAIIQEKVNGSS